MSGVVVGIDVCVLFASIFCYHEDNAIRCSPKSRGLGDVYQGQEWKLEEDREAVSAWSFWSPGQFAVSGRAAYVVRLRIASARRSGAATTESAFATLQATSASCFGFVSRVLWWTSILVAQPPICHSLVALGFD